MGAKSLFREVAVAARVTGDGAFDIDLPEPESDLQTELRAYSTSGHLVGRRTVVIEPDKAEKGVRVPVAMPAQLQLAAADSTLTR